MLLKTGYNPEYCYEWQHKNPLERIVEKQLKEISDQDYLQYLGEFMTENKDYANIPFTIVEFLKKTAIPNVHLVHYFGYHDKQYHNQEIIGVHALQQWASGILQHHGMNQIAVTVPKAGHIMKMK